MKYTAPEMEITILTVADILTASNDDNKTGDDEL